jgi:hypothetical protein
MAVRLNHTIVSARNHFASARFLAEVLGLSAPVHLGPFAIVQVGDTSLDFIESGGEITPQHYAFLVTELEFRRIRERGLTYWADPARKKQGEINEWDGGRSVYWGRPERTPAGDHHPAVRHRRRQGAQAAPAAQRVP